jgi:hypothetical protein
MTGIIGASRVPDRASRVGNDLIAECVRVPPTADFPERQIGVVFATADADDLQLPIYDFVTLVRRLRDRSRESRGPLARVDGVADPRPTRDCPV